MAFADTLRRLRLEQFLSQAELARRAGLHALTVTRLEAGATAPTTRTLRALADTLGVEPGALATPCEVAELRRVGRAAARADRRGDARLDYWADDGGALSPDGNQFSGATDPDVASRPR
jgi:transcriptional regulator with XRE-family HTH domain